MLSSDPIWVYPGNNSPKYAKESLRVHHFPKYYDRSQWAEGVLSDPCEHPKSGIAIHSPPHTGFHCQTSQIDINR